MNGWKNLKLLLRTSSDNVKEGYFECNQNKALDITPEEIVKRANITSEAVKELKQKGPGINLNVYRTYEFKDVNEDGTEELVLKRISYVLSAPFYFSDFTEVYEVNNGINMIDCYFDI